MCLYHEKGEVMEVDAKTVCDGEVEVHAFRCFVYPTAADGPAGHVAPVTFLPGLKGLYRRDDDSTFSTVYNWERFFTTEAEARHCVSEELLEFAAKVVRYAREFEDVRVR